RGPLECTRVAHHILFPDFPAGLDFMVSFHCNGEPYYKDEGKQWKLAQIKDWPQFWTYNCLTGDTLILQKDCTYNKLLVKSWELK
ncbi:hypothetical protein LCGC14_3129330, partial [marine sediment metagenome]